ncbi:MAG: hypothetical protein GY835_23290 [bacterium]|nr:hypothetical protein [bacterium]
MCRATPACLSLSIFLSSTGQLALAQVSGNAVYREGGWANNLDHAGIYCSDCYSGNPGVYEIRGYWWQGGDGVELRSFTDFLDGKTDLGAFSLSGISAAQRGLIVDTADDLDQDPDITYTLGDCLNHEATGDYVTVDEITDIRCDGVVEYSYEWNNLWVWGRSDNGQSSGTPQHHDISRIEWVEEHNNLGGDQPWFELSPKVQRGGSGTAWTELLSVDIPDPTVQRLMGRNVITWQRPLEGGNGFWHVYRRDDISDTFEKLANSAIIGSGRSFIVIDRDIERNEIYSYRIEHVNLSGGSTIFEVVDLPNRWQ